MKLEKKQVFSPMNYDALLELTTRIGGQYVEWADQATTEEEANHWHEVAAEIRQQVRQVDSRDNYAIEAKRDELRKLWRSLPETAPVINL